MQTGCVNNAINCALSFALLNLTVSFSNQASVSIDMNNWNAAMNCHWVCMKSCIQCNALVKLSVVCVVLEWHIVFISWIFKRNFHSKQPGDNFLKFFEVWIHQQQCYCTYGLKVLWVLVHCRWSDSRHPANVVMVDLWTDKTAVCVLRIIAQCLTLY